MVASSNRTRHGPPITGLAISSTQLIAGVLVFGLFVLQGHLWLLLSDGGFLWYGAIRTGLGEIPIRDFQAYDPGRYYWAALWSFAFGDGIVALRLSTAIFQSAGLGLGLLAARYAGLGGASIPLIGCVLAIWMFPWFKNIESSLLLVALFLATLLIRNPVRKQHLVSGLFVGLAAFFGKNLGLYFAVAFLLLLLLLHRKLASDRLLPKLVAWLVGIGVGYSPMLALILFAPGFFDSFVDSTRFHFVREATNIALPVPWPWSAVSSPLVPPDLGWPHVFFRLTWVLYPLLCVFGLAMAWLSRPADLERRALLLACAFVGLPYLHHAYSRADLLHMAPSISPLLLGLAALPISFGVERKAWVRALGVLVLALVFVAGGRFNTFYTLKMRPSMLRLVEHEVRGDTLLLDEATARLIRAVEEIQAERVRPDESMLILPSAPGLYAILGLRSPIWEIYATVRPTEKVLREMIPSLEAERVNWILLDNRSVDLREDLRLEHTHTAFWEYFRRHFRPVREDALAPPYRLYHRTGVRDRMDRKPGAAQAAGPWHAPRRQPEHH